jgi:glycosyltransferase involved in cell wall biosynthesis
MDRRLKILGWANDHGGCGNYRVGLPMWALEQLGHDTLAFTYLNIEVDDSVDLLVGQLISAEPRSEQWRALARKPDRSYGLVYEIDDDVWRLKDTNPARTDFEGEVGESVRRNIEMADAVTVTNNRLAEVVSAYNKNVFVLPNCIDQAQIRREITPNERLTVGWAGASGHDKDFQSVQRELKTFFRRNPQVDTHFVGVNHGPDIGRPDSRYTGWTKNLTEYLAKIDFDLGIAPLAYHAFNRSKSDLRFLEYASLGIPVVASDFGPYSESIEHGVTSFLVRHPHEWNKYLRQLVLDDELRQEVGRNARDWAATRTIQANSWRWEDVYLKVCGGTVGWRSLAA